MTWIRPWTKLIAKYPDGIEIWLTFTNNKWSLHGQYHGEIPQSNLNANIDTRITELEARTNKGKTLQTSIVELANIDLKTEHNNYYSTNIKKLIDVSNETNKIDISLINNILGGQK